MRRYLAYLVLTALLIFFISVGLFYKPVVHYPFKCYGFVEYNLVLDNKPVQLNISQDIRLFDDATGALSFNGRVVYDNHEMILNRKIKLTDASRLDEDTFKFKIHRTEKSLSDNTPDEMYNLLMNEYSASQNSLQIDLIELISEVWVISSPTAFIMICKAY